LIPVVCSFDEFENWNNNAFIRVKDDKSRHERERTALARLQKFNHKCREEGIEAANKVDPTTQIPSKY